MIAPPIKSSVTAPLNYISSALQEKPFYHRHPDPGQPASNVVIETVPTQITDLRGLSEHELTDFTVDTAGFQILKHESKFNDFVDEEEIKNKYYPEVEQLLKGVTGASRIILFDHTVRRRKHDAPEDYDPRNRGPGLRVHVDQTPKAGLDHVFIHAGADAEELCKRRVQIINVWRPLRVVQDTPLAYADFRSVNVSQDLVPTAMLGGKRDGETYSVRYNTNQKWYFYSNQQPNEVVLLKCYESDAQKGRALLTPHSAFVDPNSSVDTPPRQSIEVRALVFYE